MGLFQDFGGDIMALRNELAESGASAKTTAEALTEFVNEEKNIESEVV